MQAEHESAIARAATEIRAAGAVVLVGAGTSLVSGYPLTESLSPLVWRALDRDLQARGALAKRLGRPDEAAKSLVGDNEQSLRTAYETIKVHPSARAEFQESFQSLDAERTARFSPGYDALADLLHQRVVESVISLNWDTMLEAAYRRRFGGRLTADGKWLHKPHGDAADLSRPWILPAEAGQVTDQLRRALGALADGRPRVLVIVGYSESDEVIVDVVVRPLESKWRVVRIGPNATGELAIGVGAEDALPRLRDAILGGRSDSQCWEYVTFQTQGDLGRALDGRGLGPGDVSVCPELPEVKQAIEAIRSANAVTIAGAPGSGKSMVAYHVAHRLQEEGFEVVRLSRSDLEVTVLVGGLNDSPRPTVALVDDAQALDPAVVRRLQECAKDSLKIVIVTNAALADRRGAVEVDGKRAVRALSAALRLSRSETLAMVARFDDRIGDGWLQHSLENRLDEAERAEYPWQFMFILSGGERRARGHLDVLRQHNAAHLLLGMIAARQLLTRDIGTTLEELKVVGEAMGFRPEWVLDGLSELRRLHILAGEHHLRCPHQRYADNVLALVSEFASGDDRERFVVGMRAAIRVGMPTLGGIARLLRELRLASGYWTLSGLVDDRMWSELTGRSLQCASQSERSEAGYLLEALETYHPAREEWMTKNAETIGLWVSEANAEAGWGLGHLLNSIINGRSKSPRVFDAVFGGINAEAVGQQFAASDLGEIYPWRFLLGRLAFGTRAWKRVFTRTLPVKRLEAVVAGVDAKEVARVAALVEALADYDLPLALKLLRIAGPAICTRLATDFPEAYHDVSQVFWHPLGLYPRLLRRRAPSIVQRDTARRLLRRADPSLIAKAIGNTPRRELGSVGRMLELIREAAPSLHRRIVARVDTQALDAAAAGMWEEPPHELLECLVGLADFHRSGEPARRWIERHANEVRRVPVECAVLAPEAATSICRAGGRVQLGIAVAGGWHRAAIGLDALFRCDREVARAQADANAAEWGRAMELSQSEKCDGLKKFILLLSKVAPGALKAALDGMDPTAARIHWVAKLRGNKQEREGVVALATAAIESGSKAGPLARQCRRRVPLAFKGRGRPNAGAKLRVRGARGA